jgi:hypothetical protein
MADAEERTMHTDQHQSAQAVAVESKLADDGHRPRWKLGLSVLGMVLASLVGISLLVAANGDFLCSRVRLISGANVETAGGIALLCGVFGIGASVAARNRAKLLSSVLVVEAATLSAAIGFVARDSGTVRLTQNCGLFESDISTATRHVDVAYVFLGLTIVVLLAQARRGLHERHPGEAPVTAAAVIGMALLVAALPGFASTKHLRSVKTSNMPKHEPSAGQRKLPAGTMVFAEPDHQHVTGTVNYDRTPPAGGPHDGVWLNCGVYSRPVRNENAVHSLEHGAVWITYRPGASSSQVRALRRFVEGHYSGTERYLILSPYPGLPAPVVASAWGAQLRLRDPRDARLGEFVARFAGAGQGGEPGGPCTGGTGSPVD